MKNVPKNRGYYHYPVAPDFVFDNLDSLTRLRNIMHWTQRHVARYIGIGEEYYFNIERGTSFPNKRIYNKLAKLFEWEEWL